MKPLQSGFFVAANNPFEFISARQGSTNNAQKNTFSTENQPR
jgi:hypothetical protein